MKKYVLFFSILLLTSVQAQNLCDNIPGKWSGEWQWQFPENKSCPVIGEGFLDPDPDAKSLYVRTHFNFEIYNCGEENQKFKMMGTCEHGEITLADQRGFMYGWVNQQLIIAGEGQSASLSKIAQLIA